MKFLFISLISLSVLFSCKPAQKTVEPTGDSSMTSVDWPGTYIGTLPCSDCEGIQKTIKLNRDLSYAMSSLYKGKSTSPVQAEGKFTWNKAGSMITLEGLDKKAQPNIYQVGENKLFQLDIEGKRITGELASKYELVKLNTEILNKYWKLVELIGQPVKMTASDQREPHITLHLDGNRLSGTGGCNTFSGTYELQPGNRIRFSQNMATTLLPCGDNQTEQELLKVLQEADNYSLASDTAMTLNKARMAPLARFRVVYFK
jgi:heat shock protein HslJ